MSLGNIGLQTNNGKASNKSQHQFSIDEAINELSEDQMSHVPNVIHNEDSFLDGDKADSDSE